MEFIVRFSASIGYAFESLDQLISLSVVDKIRENIGDPLLPIDIFEEENTNERWDPEFSIPEEMARRSGHFLSRHSIIVIVPKNWLSQFSRIAYNVEHDREGQIKRIVVHEWLNKKLILKTWEDAGYPLVWKKGNKTKGIIERIISIFRKQNQKGKPCISSFGLSL